MLPDVVFLVNKDYHIAAATRCVAGSGLLSFW